jgi:osmotically-inducible protein OsmY
VKATAGQIANKVGEVLTDTAVTSGVKTKFLADSPVVKIHVDTKDGIVTLTGTVPTRAEADRAVALARESRGVKSVVDKLQIGQ